MYYHQLSKGNISWISFIPKFLAGNYFGQLIIVNYFFNKLMLSKYNPFLMVQGTQSILSSATWYSGAGGSIAKSSLFKNESGTILL